MFSIGTPVAGLQNDRRVRNSRILGRDSVENIVDSTQRSRVVTLETIESELSLPTPGAVHSTLIVAGEIEDVGIRDPVVLY